MTMLAIPAARGSESGHWYDRIGNPVYEVIGSQGFGIKPDIRHARALGLVPGVSSVVRCAASPNLTDWLIEQAVKASVANPIEPNEPISAYLGRLQAISDTTRDATTGRGKNVHKAVELALSGKEYAPEYAKHVAAVLAELARLFPGLSGWSAEKTFAFPLGYGGQVDIHTNGIVVDLKTKDRWPAETNKYGKPNDLRKALLFDDNVMQGVAYWQGLFGRRDPVGRWALQGSQITANIYVEANAENPRCVGFIHTIDEQDRAWDMFMALLEYWQAKNKHDSSWNE